MESMSISEFARRSRLSPKALRLYDEMGLLPPARVDAVTGYRLYGTDQIEPARLIAALRQLGIPLAEIKVVLESEPEAAADQIADYWSATEAEHVARRDLADFLVKRLQGKRSVMYEVDTREIPIRSLLCLKQCRGRGRRLGARQGVRRNPQRAQPAAHGRKSWCHLLHLLG
jgi:DNA-binding transcriptional MerR regulator